MSQARSSGTALRSTARVAPDVRPVGPRHAPLELVPDAQPQRRRRAMTRAYTALAVAFSGVGLFLVVFLHVLLAQGQAQLDDLDTRAEIEQVQNDRLRVAVAELESPGRIVDIARGRLGMVPPPSVTFLKAVDPSAPLPPLPTGPLSKPSPPTNAATPPITGRTTPTTAPRQAPATTVRRATTPTTVRRATTPTTAVTPRTQAGGTSGARR